MNTKMKKITSLLLALLLVLSCGAAALAADDEAKEEDQDAAEAEETEKEEDLEILGEETEDGYKIRLVNATGTNITGINIKTSEQAEWEFATLLENGGDVVFEKEEACWLCYTPGEEETEDTTYDLQIIWSDWTVGEVHDVKFSDIEEGEVQRAWNSLPYLVYTSIATGEEIDTSADEQATAEAEIAAGTFAYGGAPKSSGSSGSSGGSKSSGGGGSSSGGNSGGCIPGGGMFY